MNVSFLLCFLTCSNFFFSPFFVLTDVIQEDLHTITCVSLLIFLSRHVSHILIEVYFVKRGWNLTVDQSLFDDT